MKKLFYLPLVAAILAAQLHAALSVTSVISKETEITMGESKVVLAFTVNEDAGQSNSFKGLTLQNSGDLPFYKYGVEYVEIRTGTGGTGTLIASKDFSTQSAPATEWAPNFSENVTGGKTYSIVYRVSPRANKYTPKDSATYVYTRAYLTGLTGPTGSITVANANADVVVWAAGLINLPDKTKSMLSEGSGYPGAREVPVLTFTLRAEGQPQTVNAITLSSSGAGSFATSIYNSSDYVNRIILLADDDGIGDYDGTGKDIIVCDLDLTQSRAGDHNTAVLNLSPPIMLSAYTDAVNRRYAERTFWVLYDLGSGVADKTLTCRLEGGKGDGTALIQGEFPAGNASITIKGPDITLLSARPADFVAAVSGVTIKAMAGQRSVRMLDFSCEAARTVENITIELYNGGGSFRDKADNGVTGIYLYELKDNNPTLVSIGEVSATNNSRAVFRGVTMTKGTHSYYVAYDIGVMSTFVNSYWDGLNYVTTTENQQVKAQINSISAPGASFASYYLPVPPAAAQVDVRPKRVWVEYVSVNKTVIQPGDSFEVEIGLRNMSGLVDGSGSPIDIVEGTRPVFYTGDIGFYTSTQKGKEISREFRVTELYTPPKSMTPIFPQIITFSYEVVADNLKTSGAIFVDAQVAYENNINSGRTDIAYYKKYFDGSDGLLKPAAQDFTYKLPAYAVLNAVGVEEEEAEESTIRQDWISGIKVVKDTDYYRNFFMSGDKIPAESEIIISINIPNDQFYEPIIELYGNNQLFAGSNVTSHVLVDNLHYEWHPTENYIKIRYTVTTAPGKLVIGGLIDKEPIAEDKKQIIQFNIINTDTALTITNLLPYPSPYIPDDGDLNIGFECNEANAKYSVYIYDATGREVFREEELSTVLGYNVYPWAGDFTSGGKVGRGVYILRVLFKGTRKQDIITKFGVR